MFEKALTVIDATRAAMANPEDTSQVFRIADALSFGNGPRLVKRFRASDTGARLMSSREDLLATLTDREKLESMPAGSLAHAYLEFIDSEGITADGLVEASQYAEPTGDVDPDLLFLRSRMRDSHDLWHAVTGYHGDLLGETALLAFTFAQTKHVGVGFLAGIGLVLSREKWARGVIVDGFKRGRRARWLPSTDWLALLPLPLEEVRRRLGVGEAPVYEQIRESPFAAASSTHAI